MTPMSINRMTAGSRFLMGMGIGAIAVGVIEILIRIVHVVEFVQ